MIFVCLGRRRGRHRIVLEKSTFSIKFALWYRERARNRSQDGVKLIVALYVCVFATLWVMLGALLKRGTLLSKWLQIE